MNPSVSDALTAVISVTCRRMPDPLVATSSRSTCTTRSSASLNTFCTIRSVTFSPAINAALTSAFDASVALFACTVHRNPHPALTARVSSKASAPRTSPTTILSGRIASVNFTRSRSVISPLPSSDGGRTS